MFESPLATAGVILKYFRNVFCLFRIFQLLNKLTIRGKQIMTKNCNGRIKNNLRFLIILGLISFITGCASTEKYTAIADNRSLLPAEVGLQPGDRIAIKFFYTPQLDIEQVVRPDGRIQLQLVGDVDVLGKSPSQLREELLNLYAIHLKDPEVAVVVQESTNRRIFVGGEVLRPGFVDIPGNMSIVEAVMHSGGFRLPEAELKNIVVIRQDGDQRQGYSVDLKKMLEGNEEVDPFYLQPLDIVWVPRTAITKVDQWVDQYINRLVPRTGFISFRID